MAKKINIITLGCAKNDNDTENLAGLLKNQGYSLETDTSQADTVVVHTCSFIEAAKKESVQTILQAAQSKKKGAQLIVSGCMVQQHGKEMMEELPEVDAFLGTGQLTQIPTLIQTPRQRFLDRANPGGLTDPDAPRAFWHKGPTANLRLSEGCSHPCSFCVIPKLRGGLQSRPQEKIINEAKMMANQGIEELIIIGQDTGDWGRDLYGDKRLPQLLRELREIEGIRWIRLMYMHPVSMSDSLIEVLSEAPEKFPYLDMPLQHIDDQLLKNMNRLLGETPLRFLLDKIHHKLPFISLRTTFIVGYPGETETQFQKLLEFTEEGHFDYMGSFTYSREENTPAALKSDQISEEVKQARQNALTQAQFRVSHQKSQKRLGNKEILILEDSEGDFVWGRTKKEAPEIDAVVKIPKIPVKKPFLEIQLKEYDSYEFSAEIINLNNII